MDLASRPSNWHRGLTGIVLENIEGRQGFETVTVKDASRATKLVGNIRMALLNHEYPVQHPSDISGYRKVSSWLLKIESEHKGNINWKIHVLKHAESQKQLLQINWSITGSFQYCEIPTRGSWREWLID